HELAHVWFGKDALFNLHEMLPANTDIERFCNKVAAEFLVPTHLFRDAWQNAAQTGQPFKAIARHFKVSPIVAARRALDLRLIERPQFFQFYEQYQRDWREY